jgi:hypothetical protein
MSIHVITPDEKTRLTEQACEVFKTRNPDFFPCAANSEKLISFVHQQLGQTLDEHPFPVLVDSWQAAYDHLKQTSWFYARPEETEDDSAQTAENQRALEAANANLAACKADEIRIAKAMPLKELGQFTSAENTKLREARERGEFPVRPTGLESRPLSTVTLGLKATARANVALANPSLPRDGAEFSRLYAAELSRLRS